MASHCAMKFCPSIDSVDIKYAILCLRKAVWRETRPFRPRAGDVIHPVLWLVKGRAIARLILIRVFCLFLQGNDMSQMTCIWQSPTSIPRRSYKVWELSDLWGGGGGGS